jgi:transcriptional regulator with XRE-family HTH domain
MSDKVAIGATVEQRRKSLELAQTDLAVLTGLSRGTIRNIESGLVEPNERTWEVVERVLGWGPGSLERLKEGKAPTETLSEEPLRFISSILSALKREEPNDPWSDADRLIEQYKMYMAFLATQGTPTADRINEFTDFILELPLAGGWEEAHREETLQNIDDDMKKRMSPEKWASSVASASARMAGRRSALSQLNLGPGDKVIHQTFGHGLVKSVDGEGEKTAAIVDFAGDFGIKRLVLQYTPMRKLEEMESGAAERVPSGLMAETFGLSEDAMDLIANGKVIDYDVFEPRGSENIAFVTLLVKKSNIPLKRSERKYLSNVWDQLSLALGANEPETEGQQPLPQVHKPASKPKPVQDDSADDPWATGGFKSPTAAGFSDDPPF